MLLRVPVFHEGKRSSDGSSLVGEVVDVVSGRIDFSAVRQPSVFDDPVVLVFDTQGFQHFGDGNGIDRLLPFVLGKKEFDTFYDPYGERGRTVLLVERSGTPADPGQQVAGGVEFQSDRLLELGSFLFPIGQEQCRIVHSVYSVCEDEQVVSSGGFRDEVEMIGKRLDHFPSFPFGNPLVLSFQIDIEEERVQFCQILRGPRFLSGFVAVYRKKQIELLVIRDFLRSHEPFRRNGLSSFLDEQRAFFRPKGNPFLENFVVRFGCHN